MTDKEILQAIRCCTSDPDCDRCKSECIFHKSPDPNDCIPEMGKAVADRLEALLTLNEALNERDEASKELVQALERKNAALERNVQLLKAKVPKWVSAEEQLPVLTEREIREIEKFGIEGAPEFIVQIIGGDRSTVLMFDGEKWVDNDGNWYSITRWMAIPELPSTEEVKQ